MYDFEKYVELISNKISTSADAEEIKEEMLCHMLDKFEDLIDSGLSEEKAYKKVLSEMGDAEHIGNSLNKVHTVKDRRFLTFYINMLLYPCFLLLSIFKNGIDFLDIFLGVCLMSVFLAIYLKTIKSVKKAQDMMNKETPSLIIRPHKNKTWINHFFSGFFGIFLSLFLLQLAFGIFENNTSIQSISDSLFPLIIMLPCWVTTTTSLKSPTYMYESGLIVQSGFIAWKDIKNYNWIISNRHKAPSYQLKFETKKGQSLILSVSKDQINTLKRFLNDFEFYER